MEITVILRDMKRIVAFTILLASLTACYEDYVKDFDYSSIYLTYQYDMRTMVVGEGASFDITACLGGVINNTSDRRVELALDPGLVTADLSRFAPAGMNVAPFTALDIFKGATPDVGMLYHAEVQRTFEAFGVEEILPLPEDYFTVSGMDQLAIRKGKNTAAFTLAATSAMTEDNAAIKPVYAVGVRIKSADADTVLQGRDFAVIAVRLENMFYGNWYHGGSYVVKDASGSKVEEKSYPFSIPQEDGKVYALTTETTHSVKTNKIIQQSGSLILSFNGSEITITSDDVELVNDGRRSWYNEAKLLQDRELYLNYTFKNADGGTTEVSDTLYFRNRLRDGANEWQDEVPEHYN